MRLSSAEVLLLDFNVNCVHEHNCIPNKACGVDEMVAYFTAGKQSHLKSLKNYQKRHDHVQNVVEVKLLILLDQQKVYQEQTKH